MGKKTILFGGLTPTHELLMKGAVESLGYRAEFLPTPDNVSLSIGREFCNRGMCNPAYYTIGNLIKFLKQKAAEGIDVEKEYTFTTIGACGPCRFGMYESEYRHALKEAGFKNFKVSILNQTKFTSEGEVELTLPLVWRLIKAVWTADVIRDIGYQLRPYELEKGSVNKVISEHLKELYTVMKRGGRVKEIVSSLLRLRQKLNNLRFDYTRVKPIVNVIGEFWAHTTEGDGNYRIHSWLEEEGAEVKPEPIAGWIDYQLFMQKEKTLLEIKAKGPRPHLVKKLILVMATATLLKGLYNVLRGTLSFRPRALPKQSYLVKLARDYYDHLVVGGEGYLEVAKHIYSIKEKKAHMVLSVKPFGCMPSTQSDGAQVKVISDYPESIFISVETSGDGEVNVKSRIQMKLFEAKKAAEREFEEVLERLNLTREAFVRAFSFPELQKPFIKLSGKFIGTAARALYANSDKVYVATKETEAEGAV
jgi:predicted nucleotide-binding protein (sugar kinase/HSP70/actin superfamily)